MMLLTLSSDHWIETQTPVNCRVTTAGVRSGRQRDCLLQCAPSVCLFWVIGHLYNSRIYFIILYNLQNISLFLSYIADTCFSLHESQSSRIWAGGPSALSLTSTSKPWRNRDELKSVDQWRRNVHKLAGHHQEHQHGGGRARVESVKIQETESQKEFSGKGQEKLRHWGRQGQGTIVSSCKLCCSCYIFLLFRAEEQIKREKERHERHLKRHLEREKGMLGDMRKK